MYFMLKQPAAVDGKGEEQIGSVFHFLAEKKVYEFVCVDVLQLDGCSKAKHTKLKATLIGKKILENSVILIQ